MELVPEACARLRARVRRRGPSRLGDAHGDLPRVLRQRSPLLERVRRSERLSLTELRFAPVVVAGLFDGRSGRVHARLPIRPSPCIVLRPGYGETSLVVRFLHGRPNGAQKTQSGEEKTHDILCPGTKSGDNRLAAAAAAKHCAQTTTSCDVTVSRGVCRENVCAEFSGEIF